MKNSKVNIMVEGAVMIALATVLSYMRPFKLAWGGSITVLSMLPIVVFSIRRGTSKGFAAAFAFSLIQLGQGIMDGLFGWGLTPVSLTACILLDYLIAFTILGIAGIFRNKGLIGWLSGIALAIFCRFLCHLFSGVFVFKSVGELWKGFSTGNTWLYSLLYNGSYMLPELVFTLIGAYVLLKLPQTRRYILNDL